MKEKLRVVFLNPGEDAIEGFVGSSVEELQDAVGGGLFQAIYPFDDPVAIVCNDEGKLIGMKPTRVLRTENGDIYDVICGPAFVVGLGNEEFCSLSDALLDKYLTKFRDAEFFLNVNGKIFVTTQKE